MNIHVNNAITSMMPFDPLIIEIPPLNVPNVHLWIPLRM